MPSRENYCYVHHVNEIKALIKYAKLVGIYQGVKYKREIFYRTKGNLSWSYYDLPIKS